MGSVNLGLDRLSMILQASGTDCALSMRRHVWQSLCPEQI